MTGYSTLFLKTQIGLKGPICMSYLERKEQALRNADASLHMEGLRPSTELEESLHRVLDGQMSEKAYLEEVFQRAARKGN